MDSNFSSKIPCFVCELRQGSNVVKVPVPYGGLENICRSLLAHNPDTSVSVVDINMVEF